MRRSIGIAAATAVVLVTGGMTATAWADQSGSTEPAAGTATSADTGAPDWAGRLDRACRRVDRSIRRGAQVQQRLAADAKTKGSLAFLQRRIDAASQAGQDDLATVLGLRLQARQRKVEQLPKRLDLLEQAKATCDGAGR